MAKIDWKIKLAIVLVVTSLFFYLAQLVLFNDPRDEAFYLLESFAFLPIEILLVTIIIDSLLTQQEKRQRLEKMSMVTDSFFSEVGSGLLIWFLKFDRNASKIRAELDVSQDWSDKDYLDAKGSLHDYEFDIACEACDLEAFKQFLVSKRDFLLMMLENPNLLEHESFTELLRAAFHLIEELVQRKNLHALSKADSEHIAKDMNRVYVLLVAHWFDYMLHLKKDYPYLYSLATRMNPFNPNASAEIK